MSAACSRGRSAATSRSARWWPPGSVGLVVFLRDPLSAHAHDPDINALMKVCDVHRVPLATNIGSARLCLRSHRPRVAALASVA